MNNFENLENILRGVQLPDLLDQEEMEAYRLRKLLLRHEQNHQANLFNNLINRINKEL